MILPTPQKVAMIVGFCMLCINNNAQVVLKSSSKIAINKPLINSKFLEFSPIFYEHGLLFVSSQKSRKKKQYFDIAYTKFDAQGHLTKPTPFNVLNTTYHDGPLSISQDQQTVYITRSSLQNGTLVADSTGLNRLDIYEVSLSEKQSKKLPFNNDSYSTLHPTLAEGDSKLYFSSDRPGGYGGMDIWYSQKTDGHWNEPILLDATVNSPANEVFPYIFQDSILYFASDRVIGDFVGLDIYVHRIGSTLTEKMPAPINSPADDFGLLMFPSGKEGYFSSNRDKGNDDIFSFQSEQMLIPTIQQKAINFTFLNKSNKQPIKGATIVLTNDSKDKIQAVSNQQGLATFEVSPYEHYLLEFAQMGYQPIEMSIMDTVDFVQTITVDVQPNPCKNIEGSVTSMNLKRPLSGVNITIIPDIDSSLNFSVNSDSKGHFSYCLPAYWDKYQLIASKSGFISYEMSYDSKKQPKISLMPFDDEVVKQTIILENIYYDFNDSRIRQSSADELVRLAQILKDQPQISILLVAYTDSRGTKRYNERLARHRAIAAKDFLVNLGIESSRIKAIGRGEINIRNRCKNGVKCSEEEHRYNRRTEVVFRDIPDNVMVIVKKKWDDESL